MRTRRLAAAGLAIAGALAITPASAAAQRTYEGMTRQGRPATVVVGGDGRLEKVRIAWRTRDCQRRHATLEHDTEVYDLDHSTRRRFVHREPLIRADRERRLVSFIVVRMQGRLVRGRRRVDDRWVGTIRAVATIRRHGRVYDRCRLRSTGWRAGRHAVAMHLDSEPGEPVGQGRSWDYSHRNADVTVAQFERDTLIHFRGDDGLDWTAQLDFPSEGEDFAPLALISGHGFGCAPGLGSRMHIARIRLDRRGTIRFLRATFTQRCNGHTETLHGRISFRRGY